MKKRGIIISLFSVLLGLVFIAGSAGITLIIHNCSSCGDFFVNSGMFLPPSIPEDNCCESAYNHYSSDAFDAARTIEGSCCHFKIEKLKLTNYTTSVQFTVAVSEGFSLTDYKLDFSPQANIKTYLLVIHNKHGGRSIITYHCQYLT